MMPSQHPSFLKTSVYNNRLRPKHQTIDVLSTRKKITEIAGPLLKNRRKYIPVNNNSNEVQQTTTSPLGSYRMNNVSNLSRFQPHRIPTTQELKINNVNQKQVVYSQMYQETISPSPELQLYVLN